MLFRSCTQKDDQPNCACPSGKSLYRDGYYLEGLYLKKFILYNDQSKFFILYLFYNPISFHQIMFLNHIVNHQKDRLKPLCWHALNRPVSKPSL